jgi:hypothetical protein
MTSPRRCTKKVDGVSCCFELGHDGECEGVIVRNKKKSKKKYSKPSFKVDPLHPIGECKCAGEGKCAWCQIMDTASKKAVEEIQEEEDKRCLELLRKTADSSGIPEPLAERDMVNHPAHYGGADNPYEAIKVIEAWGLDFNLGNTVKYISRAGKKRSSLMLEDLKKAVWYLNRAVSNIENPGPWMREDKAE